MRWTDERDCPTAAERSVTPQSGDVAVNALRTATALATDARRFLDMA